jgi:hypothetical protein
VRVRGEVSAGWCSLTILIALRYDICVIYG